MTLIEAHANIKKKPHAGPSDGSLPTTVLLESLACEVFDKGFALFEASGYSLRYSIESISYFSKPRSTWISIFLPSFAPINAAPTGLVVRIFPES